MLIDDDKYSTSAENGHFNNFVNVNIAKINYVLIIYSIVLY